MAILVWNFGVEIARNWRYVGTKYLEKNAGHIIVSVWVLEMASNYTKMLRKLNGSQERSWSWLMLS